MGEREAPALPDEVWRGVDDFGDPIAIDKDGVAWSWSMTRWYEVKPARQFAAAFLAERAARVKAEALAKAERALRLAQLGRLNAEIDALEQGWPFDEEAADAACNAPHAALIALGVEP